MSDARDIRDVEVAPLVAETTQVRCKICSSADRSEIERLAVSRGKSMPDGRKITTKLLTEIYGVTKSSLHRHLTSHVQRPDAVVTVRDAGQADAELERIVAAGELPPAHQREFLGAVVAVALQKLRLNPSAVTMTHGLDAAKALERAAADEGTRERMSELGTAIASALRPPPQPTVEGEVVREIDTVDAEVVADPPEGES